MVTTHPLLVETPDKWLNIPIPVQGAFKNLIKTFIQSDEASFLYQTKNNDRLFRMQEQINNLKEKLKRETDKVTYDFDRKLAQAAEDTKLKFEAVEMKF